MEEILTSREFWKDKVVPEGKKKVAMDYDRANQLLQILKKVFDKAEIPFFLFYGTLLGAIRENDFILYDDDVDVGVLSEHAHKIPELLETFKRLGCCLCRGSEINNLFTSFYIIKESYPEKLDIVVLFPFQDKRWFIRYAHSKSIPCYVGLSYSKKYFESFKTIEFKGKKYNVPYNSEELLEEMWGNWKIATGGGQYGIIETKIFGLDEFMVKK